MDKTEIYQKSSEVRRNRFSIIGLISAGLSLTVVVTTVGFFGRQWWVADVISSFRIQYAFCGLIAGIVMFYARRKRTATIALAVISVNLIPVVLAYMGAAGDSGAASSGGESNLRIFLCNVWSDNGNYKKLRDSILKEQPDVIILQEVTDVWMEAVPELRDSHPHYIEYPEVDNFGIALYSKKPLESMEIIKVGEMQLASVHAVLRDGDKRLHLFGTHPLPPGGKEYWDWRNNQLAALADYIRTHVADEPIVLVGDLHCTPWSWYFQEFEEMSGLTHAGRGRGFHVSWPVFFPPALIPIDHCLVSPSVGVTSFRVMPPVGSDHYPLMVDILPH